MENVKMVSGGNRHVIVVTNNEEVYSFGFNGKINNK